MLLTKIVRLIMAILLAFIPTETDVASDFGEARICTYTVSECAYTEESIKTVTESEGKYQLAFGESSLYYDSLSSLMATLYEGDRVYFDSVTSDGGFALSKSITLSGTLEIYDGVLSVEAGSVCFEGLNLKLGLGSVRVKGGELMLNGGEISSDCSFAIVLDYSSEGKFTLNGGKVKSDTAYAIKSTLGTVELLYGEVISEYGDAIYNKSTLRLGDGVTVSGYGYCIVTETPISLSVGGSYFSEDVSIKYNSEFIKGSERCVILDAKEEQKSKITFFDVNGEETDLTYKNSSKYTDERCFFSVYLPFIYKFYSGSEELYRCEYLSGEVVTEPISPERLGYDFGGWYTDPALKNLFSFGSSPISDVSLFAAFSLSLPSFSVSSLSFTYDGGVKYLSVRELSHPLMNEGSFSFVWYKNSEVLSSNSDKVAIKTVSDSGDYICKLTFAYKGEFVSVDTPLVTAEVKKMQISSPEINKVSYTGILQNTTLTHTAYYRVFSEGGTNVGKYPVTLVLTDPDNTSFSESDEATLTLYFEIVKAENRFLSLPEVTDAFVGMSPTVSVSALFGTPKVYYSASPDGSWVSSPPSLPGEYYLKIEYPETDNYLALVSLPIPFLVKEDSCIGIGIEKYPNKLEYLAFDKLSLLGAELYASYESGRRARVDITDISVEYRNGECLVVSDNSAVLKYKGHSLPITVSVSPLEYDLSTLVFNDLEVIYNGKRQTLLAQLSVVGLDGTALEYTVRGGGTAVGSYTVTLEFLNSSINYLTPDDLSRTLTIKPLAVKAYYTEVEFTYDGKVKIPSGYVIAPEGKKLHLTLSGGAVNAGSYTASASVEDPNLTLENPSVSFTIAKAALDLTGVRWIKSSDRLVYSGSPHSVTLLGLPSGVRVVGYADATATDAGSYTAVAALDYDKTNYLEPKLPKFAWEIERAEYDMSGISFISSVFVYDKLPHAPEISGILPVGFDGSSPEYSFSALPCDVTDGFVTVTVSFTSKSKNYNSPSDIISSVKILPKSISVRWSSLEFVYNGEKKVPSADSTECGISVVGGGISAGYYLAEAIPDSKNYSVINSKVQFIINRAVNVWLEQPSIVGGFAGDVLRPEARPKYGKVEFVYYRDTSLTDVVVKPKEAGQYYMVARVSEGDNYLSLTSDPIAFSLSPVLPKELIIKNNRESYFAFDTVRDGDVCAHILNNNGTLTAVDFYSLEISYKSGSSLRYGDTSLTVTLGDMSAVVPVTVMRAVYDMSGVYWDGAEHIYDGGEKIATLEGLPNGVYVIEYTLNSAVKAGKYRLGAKLGYDTDNYYPPTLPECYLTISKQKLKLPSSPSYVYDGNSYTYTLPDTELYLGGSVSASAAGEYEIALTPRDGENYEFDGSSKVYLRIEKRPITLRVLPNGRSYSVESGSILDGDELGEKYYEKDGYVYISVQNENYSVTVIPRFTSKSNAKLWIILLIILILIILFLGSYIAYQRREVIIGFAGRLSGRIFKRVRRIESSSQGGENSQSGDRAFLAVDEKYADSVITDAMARSLIKRSGRKIQSSGGGRVAVDIGEISAAFCADDEVDINAMKLKEIIPSDASYVKILGGGVIDKPLRIYADAFSRSAVKMIALTGGSSYIAKTERKK